MLKQRMLDAEIEEAEALADRIDTDPEVTDGPSTDV
jgi:hypothetical protein